MIRRLCGLAAISGLAFAGMGGMALAQGGPPPHGHALLIGVEVGADGLPTSYQQCVLVANGQPVPLQAHHDHFHIGRAGEALRSAGHFPVPLAPLTPFNNCDDIAAFIATR